jgi:hypothetical protein
MLIPLLLILVLRFRPSGLLPERLPKFRPAGRVPQAPGVDATAAEGPAIAAPPATGPRPGR